MTNKTICEAHGHDYISRGRKYQLPSQGIGMFTQFRCKDCGHDKGFADDQHPVRRAVAKTDAKGDPSQAAKSIAPLNAPMGKIIHIHSVDFVKLLLQGKLARSSDGICQIFMTGTWHDVTIDDNTFTWKWFPEFLEMVSRVPGE